MKCLRMATPDDMPAVLALLKESNLPCQDIGVTHLDNFFIAISGQAVLGTVGMERYGSVALLRSVAVRPESRRTGLGAQLIATMEEHAKRSGVAHLYLLTTTAADFFARRGYEVLARSAAPEALQATTEFSSLCPSQAVCMHRSLT